MSLSTAKDMSGHCFHFMGLSSNIQPVMASKMRLEYNRQNKKRLNICMEPEIAKHIDKISYLPTNFLCKYSPES